jgi:hypothetical protein
LKGAGGALLKVGKNIDSFTINENRAKKYLVIDLAIYPTVLKIGNFFKISLMIKKRLWVQINMATNGLQKRKMTVFKYGHKPVMEK